jgi:dinuclear metal center YbgI/SA1388 family protein
LSAARKPAGPTVADVMAAVERLAPAGWAAAWDRAGLAIGRPDAPVSRVLVALTVTRAALAAARRRGADMIVSHHPLVWEPLRALRTDDPHTSLCLELAASGIACYAAHTNLDLAPGGVNDALAERLGLRDVTGLGSGGEEAARLKLVTFVPASHLARVREAVCEAGAGRIGDYTHCTFSAPGTGTFLPGASASPFSGQKGRVNEEPEHRFETVLPKARAGAVISALRAAHPYEEVAYDLIPLENRDPALTLGRCGVLEKPMQLDAFARHVAEVLEAGAVRFCGDARRRVRTVAVVGGAGASCISSLPPGTDVLVTGDVKYHDALDAEARGVLLVDAGHGATEKWVLPVLAEAIKASVMGVRVSCSKEPECFTPVKGK